MLSRLHPLIWAAAFAAALAACSHEAPNALLDPAKAKIAYAVGARLAAEDRTAQAEHREEMSRLIGARATKTRDRDRTISFLIQLQNKSAKTIASLDSGLFVYGSSGRRIGMTEFHLFKRIRPHDVVAFWYPMRYVRFSEDAGTMRLAADKPKRVQLEVTEIKYVDGSDAGYDD